jgi:hypothetical protein
VSQQIYSLDDVSKQLGIDQSYLLRSLWTMREQVWQWAESCGIKIEYQGSFFGVYDIWYLPEEKHRMWFKLRWE